MSTNNGTISLIIGPMFSGKSTELLKRVRRHQAANRKCMIIKYAKDLRYSHDFSTHDKQTMAASAVSLLSEVEISIIEQVDVIGIDEGQFFPDIVEFSERMANSGKIVVISALDGDFRRERFGDVLDLIPKSEEVVKLTAVCFRCRADASFTKRISKETDIEVIGGNDKYVAVCRKCF